jgi:8-oxo-dGTP pyrophosphatase MutT (NUDIX family)
VIVGLKRGALDALEANSLAAVPVVLRPKDAASLIILDDSGPEVRVLLGKRRADLKFMPGQFVFPGGRTDADDATTSVSGSLPQYDLRRLMEGQGTRASIRRVHALGVTALRECFEETGLMVGLAASPASASLIYGGNAVAADVSGLRYVARAITPPGRVRRFDTRFFAVWRSAIAGENPGGAPDQEFSELRWVSFAETAALDCPAITRTILAALEARLVADRRLTLDAPVPEYRMRHGRFVCELRN